MIFKKHRVGESRLLVPYPGSGSELIGAKAAGWSRIVGVERAAEFTSLAFSRLVNNGTTD